MKNTIKVANGQGFWGDSIDAPVNLVKYGDFFLFNDVGDEIVSEIMPCKVCGRDTPVPEGWSKFG